jgi:hypothetical protein
MQNEPLNDLVIIEDSDGTQALKPEIIRRGFFQIVIKGPDDQPDIKLDVTMLPENVQRLLKQAKNAAQDAIDVDIDSQEVCEYAASLRRQIRDDKETLEEARMKITARIDAFKEAVMVEFRGDKTLKNGPVPTLDNARLLLDQKLNQWLETEEFRAKERQRLENLRIESERKKKEEEQRRIDEEAARETERLRKLAEEAARKGDDETVAELVEQARDVADEAEQRTEAVADEIAMLHPAPIMQTQARPAGFTPRKKGKCRVKDPMAFFKGIVDGKIPKVYGSWDQSGLDKQASLLKDDFDYPGCEYYEESGGSSR